MRRVVSILVCAASVVGCNTARQETRVLTLLVTGDTCPTPSEARAPLAQVWPGTRIDGMSCSLDELVSIAEPTSSSSESCCFPVACSHELSAPESEALFRATCVGLACDHVAASFSDSRAEVEKALAAAVPDCKLDPTAAKPSDAPALQCVYVVDATYTCSTAPG